MRFVTKIDLTLILEYNNAMNIVTYLASTYGYGTPIFLKKVRIGGKSKSAIKMQISRACKAGDISRDGPGVYSLVDKRSEISKTVTFEKILEDKFLYLADVVPELRPIFTVGYYSGQTFLNMIGISNQVPAILEITTNLTSSKKRYYSALGRVAIIRKARTEINSQNWKMLQFLDMFYWVEMDEVIENKKLICSYIKKAQLKKSIFNQYIGLYSSKTLEKLKKSRIINAFV